MAVLAVLYAGLCKALLFHGLEYFHTDFFSFLEMSRSLFQYGELLRDNAYGHDAAIHNFYLLLAFAPLTLPLGAYGLILGSFCSTRSRCCGWPWPQVSTCPAAWPCWGRA